MRLKAIKNQNNKFSLSIVLPCFNESKNLPYIFEKYIKCEKKYLINSQLVIVNNGSTDNTNEVIKNFTSKKKNIKLLELKHNKGYGGGIIHGVTNSNGNFISWTHADCQCDLEDIFKLYFIIKNSKKKFGKGVRKNKRNTIEKSITTLHTYLSKLILNPSMNDINAQPKIFHKSFINLFKNPPLNYTVLDTYAYYLALKYNYEITTLDVIFTKRAYGSSKWKNNPYTFLTTIFMNFIYLFKIRFIL